MPNVFDQFDAPGQPQGLVGRQTLGPYPRPQQSGNVFDQFDGPAGMAQVAAQSFRELPGDPASGMVDPRVPQAPQAQPPMSSAGQMYQAEQEYQIAARQSTDRDVRGAQGDFTRPVLGRAYQLDDGNVYYDGPDGRPQLADKAKHVVLRDPETNEQLVFARTPDTDQNKLLSLGQVIAPGFAVAPLTAGGRVPVPPPRVQAANQLPQITQDAAAFDRLGVRPFGPAFASEPTRAVGKQLSETFMIGTPLRTALTESLTGARDATNRIADQIGNVRAPDEIGHMVQSGLDRFSNAGFSQLAPGVVQNLGLPQHAPVPRPRVMSQGAANAAQQAAPIRQQIGANVTQSTRGVQVPAGQPMQQTLRARTTVEDLNDAQLNTVIRASSRDTSFATRAEALYERAWRYIPALQRADNSANPNMLAAVNTRRSLGQIDDAIASQIAGQGTIDGALAARIRNPRAGNFTLSDLRAMRTEIGRALSNTNPLRPEASLNRGQLLDLYGSISRDIEIGLETIANRAAILTTRGHNQADRATVEQARQAAGALRAFRTADRYFRQGIGRIERFNQIVGAQSYEQAAKRLISAAKGGGQGNIALLRSAHAALRPEEWADVAAAVLRELGTPVASARGVPLDIGFSVQSFLTNWERMDQRAINLLFGGEHAAAINDLVRVVNRLANVEATYNTSRSATNALNVGSVLGAGGAIATGLDATVTAGGTLAAGLGTSYLLSRPAYVRWLTRYYRARARVGARIPSKRGGLAPLLNELGRMATADPNLIPILRGLIASEGGAENPNSQPDQ